ncbi:MAG TPA: copper resistance CopC family protein [Verrucomicrobiae bacterium]|jgi:methionine-rich copper-binding protein CopC|nr:copper resistance CopC family protein [Verrucomicrobiae bacterium]
MSILESNRRKFFRSAVALALGSLCALQVFAHAKLLRSTPGNKAVLTESPKTVELWFNELLEDEFNSVEIFKASEATSKERKGLAKQKPKVDTKDRTHLILQLDSLPPGDYVVEYRVLSRDSHTAPGRVSFSISAK